MENFGKDIGHALARCGFGDQLLTIYDRRTREDIRPFLAHWRAAINQELRTNSRGNLRHKYHSLNLPVDFPDMQVLENYANPICSGRVGHQGGGPMRGNGEMNLAKIAELCEQKFVEWGHCPAIITRFRTLLWEAAVVRVLRRAALEADEKEKEKRLKAGKEDWSIIGPLRPSQAEAIGTPASLVVRYLNMSDEGRRRTPFANSGPTIPHANDPKPLIVKIVGIRQHISTDRMSEYRVEICPIQLVVITRSGIKGIHPEPVEPAAPSDDDFLDLMDGSPQNAVKKPPPDHDSTMRMWLPASMMCHVHPGLVEKFEAAEEAKKSRKSAGNGKGKGQATEDNYSDAELSSSSFKPPPRNMHPTKKGPRITDVVIPTQDLQSSTSAIDPWFAPDQYCPPGPSRSPSFDVLSAYFLCSENPDDPTAIMESDHNTPSDGDLARKDKPRDRFDILFDQIMGIAPNTCRSQKSTTTRRKRPMGSTTRDVNDGENQGRSTTTRTAKRNKIAHAHVPDGSESIKENQPKPHFRRTVDADAINLSQLEHPCSLSIAPRTSLIEIGSSTSRSRPAKSVACSPVRTANRYYPEPSSQDSRLFLDDADVIIDLT